MTPTPLRVSASDFGVLFENSPVAMAMSRLSDSIIVKANAAFLAMYEYTREEVVGHTSLELGLWARREERDEMIRRLRAECHLHGFPHEYRSKSGRQGRSVVSIDLLNLDGELHMLGTLTDLAGHDRLQRALDESHQQLQMAQEVTGIGVWEWNPVTRHITWSPQQERIFGLPVGGFDGTYDHFIRHIHPEDRQMVDGNTVKLQEKDGVFSHEFRIVRTDGAVRWISSRGRAIRDADGRIIRVIGFDLDDTERLSAAAAIRDSEARYRGLFAAESDAIVVAEIDGLRIVDTNAAAQKMYGYTAAELLGLTRPDLSAYPEVTRKSIASGSTFTPLRWQRRKDGTRFPAEISSNRFQANGIEMSVTVIRDISTRLTLEEELRQANTVLENRVARRTAQLRQLTMQALEAEQRERQTIAHDLHDDIGQLLYAAKVRLGTLQRDANDDAAREVIGQIDGMLKAASEHVRNLTAQLNPPVLERLGLVPALHWLGEEIERLYELRVEVEDDGPDYPLPSAQAAMIFRTVRELLINVFKHARCTHARVDIRCGNGGLEIAVIDHGIGMAPDTDKRVSAQSGYGLESIRERLLYLSGSMQVAPTPGGGTTVTLHLPLARPAAADAPA